MVSESQAVHNLNISPQLKATKLSNYFYLCKVKSNDITTQISLIPYAGPMFNSID